MPRAPISPLTQLIQDSRRWREDRAQGQPNLKPRPLGISGRHVKEPDSSGSESEPEDIFEFEQDTPHSQSLTEAEKERFRREVPLAFFSERKPTPNQKSSAGSSNVAKDKDNSGQGSKPGGDLHSPDTVHPESTSHSGVSSEALPKHGSGGPMKEFWKPKREMASEAQKADAAMKSGGKVTDAKIGEMEDWLKASLWSNR